MAPQQPDHRRSGAQVAVRRRLQEHGDVVEHDRRGGVSQAGVRWAIVSSSRVRMGFGSVSDWFGGRARPGSLGAPGRGEGACRRSLHTTARRAPSTSGASTSGAAGLQARIAQRVRRPGRCPLRHGVGAAPRPRLGDHARGHTADQDQARFDELTAQGLAPTLVGRDRSGRPGHLHGALRRGREPPVVRPPPPPVGSGERSGHDHPREPGAFGKGFIPDQRASTTKSGPPLRRRLGAASHSTTRRGTGDPLYSHSAYTVLTNVVERASGQTRAATCRGACPIGVTESSWPPRGPASAAG